MGLFRPYEQGTSKKTGPAEETVEAEPGSSTESSSSSATAAPKRAPKTSVTGKKTTGW
ncbi:alpha-ribazole-5'-phosphate phosphatase [Cutibacterium acnes JCM 18909]|nr:alpha-ribazole-5'-phosphate phosphatase [Cutibacterium acnes JCM 18909]